MDYITKIRIDVQDATAYIRKVQKKPDPPFSPAFEEPEALVQISMRAKLLITCDKRPGHLAGLTVWKIVKDEDLEGLLTVQELARIPKFQLDLAFKGVT